MAVVEKPKDTFTAAEVVEMLTANSKQPLERYIYTVDEVAKILKVNNGFVNRLRKAGLIPFMRLGCYKCRKEALEKFLKEYEGKDVNELLN